MPKKLYISVNGVAREVKKIYVGVDNIAREVKKGFVGVEGVARSFFSGEAENYVQVVVVQNSTTSYTVYVCEYDSEFTLISTKSISIGNYSVCATYNRNSDEIVVIHAGSRASQATVEYYDRETMTKQRTGTVSKISSYGYYPTRLIYHPLANCYVMQNYRDGWKDGDHYSAVFDANFTQLDLWGSDCVFSINPCSANAIFCKRSSYFYLWDGTKRIQGSGSDSNGGVGAGHPYDRIALFTTIFGWSGRRTWRCHETIDGFPDLGGYSISYSDAAPFYNPDNPNERWITPVIDWSSGQPGFMILTRNFQLSRNTAPTTYSPYFVFNQMSGGSLMPRKEGGAIVTSGKTVYILDKDGNVISQKDNALAYSITRCPSKEFSTELLPTFEPLKLY